jgi:hypothetical protein
VKRPASRGEAENKLVGAKVHSSLVAAITSAYIGRGQSTTWTRLIGASCVDSLEATARLAASLDPGIGPGPSWPDGIEVALGRGITVDLRDSQGRAWHAAAILQAQAADDPADRALTSLIGNLRVERCELRVFALGLAVVAFEVSGIPNGCERDFIRLGRILEFASYGQAGPNAAYTGVVTKLQESAMHILDAADTAGTLTQLTARRPTYGTPVDGYLPIRVASGYTQVVLEEQGDDHAAILAIATDYEGQRGLSQLDMDDADVWLGWAVTIVSMPKTTDVARILSLLELCQLFYGLVESFEVLLTRRSVNAARQSFDGRSADTSPFDPHSLYRLRTLALALNGVTSSRRRPTTSPAGCSSTRSRSVRTSAIGTPASRMRPRSSPMRRRSWSASARRCVHRR